MHIVKIYIHTYIDTYIDTVVLRRIEIFCDPGYSKLTNSRGVRANPPPPDQARCVTCTRLQPVFASVFRPRTIGAGCHRSWEPPSRQSWYRGEEPKRGGQERWGHGEATSDRPSLIVFPGATLLYCFISRVAALDGAQTGEQPIGGRRWAWSSFVLSPYRLATPTTCGRPPAAKCWSRILRRLVAFARYFVDVYVFLAFA